MRGVDIYLTKKVKKRDVAGYTLKKTRYDPNINTLGQKNSTQKIFPILIIGWFFREQ